MNLRANEIWLAGTAPCRAVQYGVLLPTAWPELTWHQGSTVLLRLSLCCTSPALGSRLRSKKAEGTERFISLGNQAKK